MKNAFLLNRSTSFNQMQREAEILQESFLTFYHMQYNYFKNYKLLFLYS